MPNPNRYPNVNLTLTSFVSPNPNTALWSCEPKCPLSATKWYQTKICPHNHRKTYTQTHSKKKIGPLVSVDDCQLNWC